MLRLIKACPDGYTKGSLTWDSMITVPYLDLVPGYGTEKRAYLANVTIYPAVLAVNADTPWETVADFVTDAKANPENTGFRTQGPRASGACTGWIWRTRFPPLL